MGDYCLTTGAGAGSCYSAYNTADQAVLTMAGVLAPDGAVVSDASVLVYAPDGSASSQTSSPDGSPSTTGPNQSDSAPTGEVDSTVPSSCLSPQTAFGNTAQGDSNPNFTSGVGVRTANSLLIFSSYVAPPEDAGAGDDASAGSAAAGTYAGSGNYIYLQAFDPKTANSLGPAQPLFAAPPGTGLAVESAAVAPGGQIALTFNYGGPFRYENGTGQQASLYAAFLSAATPDAGAAGVTLAGITQLVSGTITGQPHVIWSQSTGTFLFSWEYLNTNWFVGTKTFSPNGQAAGGADPVPTDDPTARVLNYYNNVDLGSVATGPSLLGMAFASVSTYEPMLTILDLNGNLVGSPVQLYPLNTGGTGWETVGAVADGFVCLFSTANAVSEVFVPTAADAGAVLPDAGDAGIEAGPPPLVGFTFTGEGALDAHAISDNSGGAGGVGVGVLYATGLSFAYIQPDGLTHIGATLVIPHTYVEGDLFNIMNFGGSFGMSLYSGANHSTQMAASGCQ